MASETAGPREAVGVFSTADALQSAVDELLSSGFDRAEISLLAGYDTVTEKLGHIYDQVEALEDEPEAPRSAFISKESLGDAEGGLIGGLAYVPAVAAAGAVVASGGALAAVAAAAALAGGAGALIGTALAAWVGKQRATHLQEQIDHGGLLLWVRTLDEDHEKRATDILTKNGAHDVHLHELPSAA
jgi:hypothetical protein